MKRLLRPLTWALGIVVLALLLLGVEVARISGTFHAFEPGFAGHCATVTLVGSAEDLQIDRERGVAYLSVLDRSPALAIDRASHESTGSVTGSIMLLDLNLAEPTPRAALAYDPPGFRPHGISLFKPPGEAARLFAISHLADGTHRVEIAEQSGGAFFPKETVQAGEFVHPNALVAVGPRQFYLVNDSDEPGGEPRLAGILMRRGHGSLVYFDGQHARVLDRELGFPAGIAASPDGTRLYVGEFLAKQLRIYQRDLASGAVKLEETVALESGADNINVDDAGVVWIAAHPKMLTFSAHVHDPARRAPTQVLRFDPRQPKPAAGASDARLTQVYGDDGAEISAGTVAAHWRDEFLVSALLDPKVLICKPSP